MTIYLKVKCILTFLVELTPKSSLIHEINHICNIQTLGDTRKISRYPTFPYVSTISHMGPEKENLSKLIR